MIMRCDGVEEALQLNRLLGDIEADEIRAEIVFEYLRAAKGTECIDPASRQPIGGFSLVAIAFDRSVWIDALLQAPMGRRQHGRYCQIRIDIGSGDAVFDMAVCGRACGNPQGHGAIIHPQLGATGA